MAGEVLHDDHVRVKRFPIGARHFVYEAVSAQGNKVVVRVSRQQDAAVAQDALYWSAKLRPLGVPLPEVLYADTSMERHAFPFVILERLPGVDLGVVINSMSPDALHRLAGRLTGIQSIVSALPPGLGYGFTSRLEGPFPFASWGQVVRASIKRSRSRIREAGVFGEGLADRVEATAEGLTDYFDSVPPTPFLHDITTRNVIVDDSLLSGIVDVDDVCFGDQFFLVGLIRVALLANSHSPRYVDSWTQLLRPDAKQRSALGFYTTLFCLDFMGEVGQRFNRLAAAPVDQAYAQRLRTLLDRSLAS